MEDLKTAKQDAFAVIGFHTGDSYADSQNAFSTRYHYYSSGSGVPFSVIGGSKTFLGGFSQSGASMYSYFLPAYNTSAAIPPTVDISLSLDTPGHVLVQVSNISKALVQGTLQIALVERYRPEAWRDNMNIVDFISRTMMPGPNGQAITLSPSQSIASDQAFSVQADWNYCSIVAFFQNPDKSIAQGAMIDIENSIPIIQFQGNPKTGDLWLKGSTHSLSWSSDRPLSSVVLEYSIDGGATWTTIQSSKSGTDSYSWKAPDINSSQCLLAVRDSYGGAKVLSGLFAIGIKGDFNGDNKVDASDRSLLVEYLIENKAALLSGADLNGDGTVDLFDLLYFDASFGK
jgi:hypothetical protein